MFVNSVNPKLRERRRAERVRRWLRRAARLVIAVTALIALLGAVAGPALAAIAATAAAPTCHCPHADEGRRACPCCTHDDSDKGGCLPVADGCSSVAALAPAIWGGDLIPLPALVGIVDADDIPAMRGRSLQLRIERPPRG